MSKELEKGKDRRVDDALRVIFENIDGQSWGIVTQQGYKRLERRLDDHAAQVEERLHRWLVVGFIAFAFIGLTSTGALIGFGILLDEQNETDAMIQEQRYNSLLEECEERNDRHDEVIDRVDEAVTRTPPPSARQKRVRESAQPFKLILEAAVPYTVNCREYAQDRVDGTGP